MFENTKPRIGQELLDVPMGDMIRQMAFAIAEAQIVLDQNSIDVAEMMGGLTTVTDDLGNVTFEDSRVYFGTERISKGEAIARHNSTNSIQEKAEIRAALTAGSFIPQEVSTALDSNGKLAADKFTNYSGAFYLGHGTTGDDDEATEVAYGALQITSVDAATDSTVEISLPRRISMLECGFTPTFYQFVDTIIEVKISIKYTQEGSYNTSSSVANQSPARRIKFGFGKIKSGKTVQIAQVNAAYSQKYSYSAEGSSLLRTKLVPIPAPTILEQRIQRMIEEEFSGGSTPSA